MSPRQSGEKTQRQNQICQFSASSWSFLNSSVGTASLIVLNRSAIAKCCGPSPWALYLIRHSWRVGIYRNMSQGMQDSVSSKISTAKFRGFNTKLLCFKFRGRFTKTRHTVLMIAPGTWCLLLVYRRRCFATWRLARLPEPDISQAATAFVEDVFQCCKLLGLRWAATWQYFLGSVWLNAQIGEGGLISWLSSENKNTKNRAEDPRGFSCLHLILGRNCKAVGQVLHLLLQATHFLQDLSFRASKLHMTTYGQKKWQPLQRQNSELWTSFVFAVFGRWGTARSILCPEALQDAIQSWLNSWQQQKHLSVVILTTSITR